MDRIIESPIYKNEYEFQYRLYTIFENAPYKHTCYLDKKREGFDVKTFSMEGTRKRIDIYMMTNRKWPYHEIFPVIGIEVKLAKKLGQMIDAFDQVKMYSEELPKATYLIDYKPVQKPKIYLIVTPDSFYYGDIYQWKPPKNLPYRGKEIKNYESGWIVGTEWYERFLWGHGATILRQGFFITNDWGENGDKKWEKRFDL